MGDLGLQGALDLMKSYLPAWPMRMAGERRFPEGTLHSIPHLPQCGEATSQNKCLGCPTTQAISELEEFHNLYLFWEERPTDLCGCGLLCFLKGLYVPISYPKNIMFALFHLIKAFFKKINKRNGNKAFKQIVSQNVRFVTFLDE